MSAALDLSRRLIARPSVTPADCGCQELIGSQLEALGFRLEHLRFGEVDNLWARHGNETPLLCFAGHTDVVPPGPAEAWHSEPFSPEIRDGYLYGRGAADMKGALAAMVAACGEFVAAAPAHRGSLAFLLTSDEEGLAIDGTQRVIETLEKRGEKIDWCVVGEPSSAVSLGDTLRIGRRGSLNGYLRIEGLQGHVAYPDLARNPIHMAAPALERLSRLRWDSGNELFPATSLQFSGVNSGASAVNVIPGLLEAQFSLRFSPEDTPDELKAVVAGVLDEQQIDYALEWHLSGMPYLTADGELMRAARRAIRDEVGVEPELSTGGGTSDGRFIAPTGAQVVELGVVNATIHQVDECVRVEDIERLQALYRRIIEILLGN